MRFCRCPCPDFHPVPPPQVKNGVMKFWGCRRTNMWSFLFLGSFFWRSCFQEAQSSLPPGNCLFGKISYILCTCTLSPYGPVFPTLVLVCMSSQIFLSKAVSQVEKRCEYFLWRLITNVSNGLHFSGLFLSLGGRKCKFLSDQTCQETVSWSSHVHTITESLANPSPHREDWFFFKSD